MDLEDYRKLASIPIAASASGSGIGSMSDDGRMAKFQVLCRIDAYADYVAEIEAATAEEAVELACEEHDDYCWEFRGTIEFDDRKYVALDIRGDEIEGAELGDF